MSGVKKNNNNVGVLRAAFNFGFRDHPELHNPAAGLKSIRICKKDRPVIDPFRIDEAETLIAGSITIICSSNHPAGLYGICSFLTHAGEAH
jgi:hypothetical protein